MPLDVALKPCREVPWKSKYGKTLLTICRHRLVPGLDAMFCPKCRIYYVDLSIREPFESKKKRKS